MNYRIDETWHRLLDWTYGQAPSERLAAQILHYVGYRDLDPIHPLGGPDGGKDAISQAGERTVMAVYFPRGQQLFATIRTKFLHDLEGAKKNKAAVLAFVTNQEITAAERSGLENLAKPLELHLHHLERVATILDTPNMESVRRQFLGIDRRALNPTSNPADHYIQIADNYARARPMAKKLVTTSLPPAEFLDYLSYYNFRSGRVPIDKQTAISDLYTRIAYVKAITAGRDLSQHPEIMSTLQAESRLEVLTALPALGVFFERLEEHCRSISQVTSTEIVRNPTHLGIFTRPEEIDPTVPGFSSHVFKWETTARSLAMVYRTEILGE